MKTRVERSGSGLVVRIPSSVAKQAGLKEDADVTLSLVDGKLIVEPLADKSPTLDELLKRVTKANLHGERVTGPAMGKEVW